MLLEKSISYALMKYVRSIWYFHLNPYHRENSVWVSYNQLSPSEKEVIHYDTNYSNPILSDWDASYQALMRGVMKVSQDENNQIDEFKLSPIDSTFLFLLLVAYLLKMLIN